VDNGERPGMGEAAGEEAKTGGSDASPRGAGVAAPGRYPFTLDGVSADAIEISGRTMCQGMRQLLTPWKLLGVTAIAAEIGGGIRRSESLVGGRSVGANAVSVNNEKTFGKKWMG